MNNPYRSFRWVIKKPSLEQIELLSTDLGIGKEVSTILVNRGISNHGEAREFLQPSLQNLNDPYLLLGMEEAVTRITSAIRNSEKIGLYGDYDVDGITSTSLLYKCLKLLNADVFYYIPHRLTEGYGVNTKAIENMHREGTHLIITLDCGIKGGEAITLAKQLGMDVIITDHHEPGDVLPEVVAIINPKHPKGNYPFRGITAVGVAFKLAWAVCLAFSPGVSKKVQPHLREFLLDALSLVALGTVADVAPLIKENRTLIHYGLQQLQISNCPGIKALKKIANLTDVRPITPHHVGFRIGPRINAMGRLNHANVCVELLTTRNYDWACKVAQQLETENRKRKALQNKILQEAREQILKCGFENDMVLVLAHENWHPGVVGIVASNLQAQYYRPICVIALQNGKGRGSARSIPGFHLCDALQACNEHLITFGGHQLAAGFEVQKDNIPLLRESLNRHAQGRISVEQMQQVLEIDAIVKLEDLQWDLFYQLEKLSPFGEGNPVPLLIAYDVEIIDNPPPHRCGTGGEHLNFWVRQGNAKFRAIGFSLGSLCNMLTKNRRCDIAFSLNKNSWGGSQTLELEIKDIKEVRCINTEV